MTSAPLREERGTGAGAARRQGAGAGTVFLLGLLVAGSGVVSPPLALVGGIAFGFLAVHPYREQAAALARVLLQLSVILLGFGLDLRLVLHVGRAGFLDTAMSLCVAVATGLLLGRVLGVKTKASYLITLGTAICGGSAIAALAPIVEASEEEISVSMGTVFLLNSVALLLFPAVGWWLHLSQSQFGLWAALAIHDTSSVVGASARYGTQALAIGTTVKLARALWIVPVSLLTAAVTSRQPREVRAPNEQRQRRSIKVPWFILLFVSASVLSTYVPRFMAVYLEWNRLGRLGLTATLYLIGTSLSRRTLQTVGLRPLLQGLLLWLIVGSLALLAVRTGFFSI